MNAIEQLKSVLCDHTGKCSITGSEEDRAIVEQALQSLAAIEAALAKPVQEPIGYIGTANLRKLNRGISDGFVFASMTDDAIVPLYTSPPAREPLTVKQIQTALNLKFTPIERVIADVRLIEAAHGIGAET